MSILKNFPLLFVLISNSMFSQSENKIAYHSPLGIPLVLSANFGELRPNHFHMGVDFKTNGKEGYNIYSIADGFVSRVKVSPFGYGKVVYIDHPNGVTSVYAHCSEFKGKLDSLVKATQELTQNYEVEIFPAPDEIKVLKGEIFALSGNTGNSFGPHLHFELRDTETEHALNPLVFGFEIQDHRPPDLKEIKVYSVTEEGYRVNSNSKTIPLIKVESNYQVKNDTILIPTSFIDFQRGIGLAVYGTDKLDGAENQCGIYKTILKINGDTLFGQQIDRIPFESTRFVNCHKDYEAYANEKKKFHKTFKTNENDLPIYLGENNGILKAKPGDTIDVELNVFDAAQNRSITHFTLVIQKGDTRENPTQAVSENMLLPASDLHLKGRNNRIDFPAKTVYEPIEINEQLLDSKIGNPNIPVHNPYTIAMPLSETKDGKHYVEIVSARNSKHALNVEYVGDSVFCSSKYFGSYCLKRDTIAPTIRPKNFSAQSTSTTLRTLIWTFSELQTEINDYDLLIDGKWYLLEYESKGEQLIFHRPDNLQGLKEVQIVVKDICGNSSVWSTRIEFR